MKSTKKLQKLVEQEMSNEVSQARIKKINKWRLTEVEVMGKIYAMTDKAIIVTGKKADAIDALKRFGSVSPAREVLLTSEVICGYRTVDMFLVTNNKESTYYFAERI